MKIAPATFSGLLPPPPVSICIAVRGYGVPVGKPRQVLTEATVVCLALP